MLTREQFLAESDLQRKPVDVPGFGTVVLREMSVGERLDFRRKWLAQTNGAGGGDERDTVLSLALVAASLCVPDGSPMFADDEIHEAVAVLRRKSQRTVETLQRAFIAINGLTDEEVEAAVGKSTEIPSATSSSGSPVISDSPASGA
jgi:hypothetical protein